MCTVDCFSRLLRLFLTLALVLGAVGSVSAQQGNQQGDGEGGGGGEREFGLQDPDDVFSGGIERRDVPETSGAVGDQDPGSGGGVGGGGGCGGGGLGGLGGFGGLGGLGGFGGFGQLFGGFGQQQNQRTIRARLVSGLQVAPPPPPLVRRNVNVVLDSIAASQRFENVVVRMDGRTAVLTGAVGSEADKRMAKLLVRLEPGVGDVENQLVIRP